MNVTELSRRAMLAVFGGGTAAAVSAQGGAVLAGRALLVRQEAVPGAAVRLDEGGRSGVWLWRAGDFSAAVRADPLQGLTVAHAQVAPSRGAWVREWDGMTGRPEWFGARANAPGFDNQLAIQAALDLCPAVQLGAGSYYVTRGLRIRRSGVHLFGGGHTQTDQGANGSATQIVCTDPRETILQIGPEGRARPANLVECVRIEGFTVNRSADPFTPASGILGAIGISLGWCVNCHAERVLSINSCRGWYFGGTVETYIVHCGALVMRQRSSGGRSVFVGFHVDQNSASIYNGGNASLYLTYCRAFPANWQIAASLTYGAGLRFDGGWVDTYLHGFESGGGIQYGIHGIGDGVAKTSFRTEDLIVTNCVLDPGSTACVWLEDAGPSAAITLANNYFATQTGTAVVLSKIAGSVTVQNNQFIVDKFGGTGLSAVGVNGLRTQGNIFTGPRQPIVLSGCTNFHLSDTINGRFAPPGDYPAIGLVQCSGGTVDCTVGGVPNSYTRGVELRGELNTRIEVRCTGLNPETVAGGVSGKLVHNGVPVLAQGPFGRDCLASGIMR